MDRIINGLCYISFSVSFLILAIIAARYFLRKASCSITCFLWVFVGIRLLCPIQIESAFSLIPSQPAMKQDSITWRRNQTVMSPIEAMGSLPNSLQDIEQETIQKQNIPHSFDKKLIMVFIWMLGILLMLGYSVISCVRLKRKVRFAIPIERLEGKIYECEAIETPFLFGFIHPKIYIPEKMDKQSLIYVIAHEKAHILRRDHLIKAVGYLLLVFYWFHPLVWISYSLLCKDIEQACDEKVIRMMGFDCKKAYSEALLKCAIKRNSIGTYPVAFGEGEVKSRVKNILNYKKPAMRALVAAVLVCIFVGACFMTQQKGNGKTISNQEEVQGFVNEWANAYVSRNALPMIELSSETIQEQRKENHLLEIEEDGIWTLSSLDELNTISAFFEHPHEGNINTEQQVDLDQDGVDEIITLENLDVQGGDGGYYVHIYRVVNGERKEIALPSIYEEKFPFASVWSEAGVEVMIGNESIVQIPRGLVEEMYKKRTTPESPIFPKVEESIVGDCISGFTVMTSKNGDIQLVLKSYLQGINAHADCFGYGIVKLQLSENDTWKIAYEFVRDEN